MPTSAEPERSPARIWTARLVVLFGLLVAANEAVAWARGREGAVTDVAFAVLLVAATVLMARGLRSAARWAWPAVLALAAVGLFFLAPITGTMLLGGGLDPVGTGWDVVFFPLATVVLLTILVLLRSIARRAGGGRRPRSD